jgi:hypothetical protein
MVDKLEDVSGSVTAVADTTQLTLFDPHQTTVLAGIRVFDIGQGDCIGLLDQAHNVFCYVDYGGLGDHPDRNNPAATASRMPVKLNGVYVSVILTHWDKDHYYSAKNYNTSAQQCHWLVPRQLASPQAVRFAANLANAKCWPEAIGQQHKRFPVGSDQEIEIRKCQAFNATALTEDRNVTGLAITLLNRLQNVITSYMLLPGDCHFDGIPGLPHAPIRTLIAYHHGSQTGWKGSTSKAIDIANLALQRFMAYSYGQNNTYHHPRTINYQPHWDPSATHTPMLRGAGVQFADFLW